MEERIEALEEEMKVLKNQIQSVLLDIKDTLATGGGYPYIPPLDSSGTIVSSAPGPLSGATGAADALGQRQPAVVLDTSLGGGIAPPPVVQTPAMNLGGGVPPQVAQMPAMDFPGEIAIPPQAAQMPSVIPVMPGFVGGIDEPSAQSPGDVSPPTDLGVTAKKGSRGPGSNFLELGLVDSLNEQGEPDSGCSCGNGVPSENGNDQVIDLLTVSVLAQWLSRAVNQVGKSRVTKVVEIYDITGNVPSRLKQTMLLLADLYSDSNRGEDSPENEDMSASASIQLLIELDSLLRYRSGALESVVVTQLLNGGLNSGKSKHG